MNEIGQNPANIGSPAAEPTKATHPIATPKEQQSSAPAKDLLGQAGGDLRYATGKPTSVMVFGVLSIVFGCYYLVRLILSSYQILMNERSYAELTITQSIMILLLPNLSACLWIWLIILGIGLLKMKKWSRRGSVLYAWIKIGLFALTLIYTAVILLSGLINPPQGRWSFWMSYVRMAPIVLIYPLLLLIFMKTAKVKEAFRAIGG